MCECLGGDLIGMGWFGNTLMLLLWSSLLAGLVWGLDRLLLRRGRRSGNEMNDADTFPPPAATEETPATRRP